MFNKKFDFNGEDFKGSYKSVVDLERFFNAVDDVVKTDRDNTRDDDLNTLQLCVDLGAVVGMTKVQIDLFNMQGFPLPEELTQHYEGLLAVQEALMMLAVISSHRIAASIVDPLVYDKRARNANKN